MRSRIPTRRLWTEIEGNKRLDYLRKFDYFLMGVVLIITAIGLVFLKSAMYSMYEDHGSSAMVVQIAGLILGLILAMVLCYVDYGIFKKFCIPFYIANIFMMLLVYTPLGITQYDSRSWLNLYVTTYQPSELMKLAMILVLAKQIETIHAEGFTWKRAAGLLIAFGIPLGLVVLQKDIGQAMVFVFIFLVVIFVGGIKWWFIASVVGAGGVMVPFLWKFYMNDTRRDRLLGFLDPEKYADYTLQLRQSITAIGSGQLVGKGIGEGPMNNGKKILVKMTDSIFAVIGEEAGFIGTAAVVGLMAVMLVRIIFISSRARDIFGKCIAAGIFAMFAFNIFENIGMNLGIMPITGLPLPFFSKGGSAMVTNFIAVGFLLSISLRKVKGFFSES